MVLMHTILSDQQLSINWIGAQKTMEYTKNIAGDQ